MCDRIAVLDQGVVQQVGTPLELFDQPANRFVAQFVGSVNLVESDAGLVAFRPHAVVLGAPHEANGLSFAGRIVGSEFLGEFVRYEVKVGDAVIIADQPHRVGAPSLATGSEIHLSVPPSEIRPISR